MSNIELEVFDKEKFKANIDGFTELFEECFGRAIKKEYLQWRYMNNPFTDFFMCVAKDNGKIVANYSVCPYVLLINNKKKKIGLSMTTMTHPMYEGKGLFIKLANIVYGIMKDRGYEGVVGFPNNNSHGIFNKKLGWNSIYEIPTKSLDLQNIIGINYEEMFHIEDDSDFIYKYDNVDSHNKILFYRNGEILKWRYKDNPYNNYKNIVIRQNENVSTYCVYKVFQEKEVDIVEIGGENIEEIRTIINHIIKISKKNEISKINIWINIWSNLNEVISRLGFINQEPITYFGGKVFDENSSEIENYKNWIINMGDSDVY